MSKMKYKVIKSHSCEMLEKEVNESLDEGWALQGGVSCSVSESEDCVYYLYTQSMILQVEDEQRESESFVRVVEK